MICFSITSVRVVTVSFLLTEQIPSRFGSVVSHPDLDGEVSGSSPGHIKVFKNGNYCSSACADHNELEYGKCLNHKKAQLKPYTMDLQTTPDKGGIIQRVSDEIKGYKTY